MVDFFVEMITGYYLFAFSLVIFLISIYMKYKNENSSFYLLAFGFMVAIGVFSLCTSMAIDSSKEVQYRIVDSNNKKYEIKGRCSNQTMTCDIGNKTIKVKSFEKIK